jgi:hypothetical protein
MNTITLWTEGKDFEEIQDLAELDIDAVIVNLHEDVLCLKENLRLANMLINKIDDKKYRQMIATYKALTEQA